MIGAKPNYDMIAVKVKYSIHNGFVNHRISRIIEHEPKCKDEN
jgi:hypothetical protein